jgi:signal peptidase I
MNAQMQLLNSEVIPVSASALATPVRHAERAEPLSRQILICIAITAMAVLSYFLITRCVVQNVRVQGASMSPTLHNDDSLFLNRFVYLVRSPTRGEIVVLRDPTDQALAVKRVIGVAGDTVDVKGGKVYLNGEKLNESYIPSGVPTFANPPHNQQSFKLAKNEYFVLGDNRMNSADGRTYGAVDRKAVLGRIIR